MPSTTSKQKEGGLSLNESFEKTVQTIAQDMPVLMHGSGDVDPNRVLPETAHLVSALTVQYMAKLVDAALDSQRMLCDSSSQNDNSIVVPPKCFPQSRQPQPPPPPNETASRTKRKRRVKDEFWDEPLKEPKIRGKTSEKKDTVAADDDNDEEWVGVAGVDMHEGQTRATYVRGPCALATQAFIFPICHDVYAYGRVMEVQAARRSIAPLLMDPVMMEMVRTEGRHEKKKPKKKKKDGKKKHAKNDNISDPEDEEANVEEEEDEEQDNDDEGRPVWPGLEDILPVHRTSESPL